LAFRSICHFLAHPQPSQGSRLAQASNLLNFGEIESLVLF
jgi:hypothetical protein